MRSKKIEAIVIKLKNSGEADRFVRAITPEGILDCSAKGSRKLTSTRGAKLEILNLCEFFISESSNYKILTEISLIDSFSEKLDTALLGYIFYFAELIDKGLEHQLSSEMYFQIRKLRGMIIHYKFHTILKLQNLVIEELGISPDISSSNFTPGKTIYADSNYIGYSENKASSHSFEVNDRILKIQNFILANPIENIVKLNLTNNDFKVLLGIQNSWIQKTIERKFNSLNYINVD